ncbi:MAG: ATP-dependent DNA ligase [Anaerolineae bacterium]
MQTFAQTAEALAATRSRLKKAAILETYFGALDDPDLYRAALYLSGRTFPLWDQRVLSAGFANVRDALLLVAPDAMADFDRLLLEYGDVGDAAAVVMARRADPTPTLTLAEIASLFEALASAKGARARTQLVADVLRRATAIEARYLVKLIMGELRVGLQEGQVEDAIARAYGHPVEAVQWANMLLGDLGETAVLARHGRLADARMRLFHPLKFMLASPVDDIEALPRQMPGGFAVEDKYDGVRAQVHKQGDRLTIYSRTLDEIGHRFPELHADLLTLPGEFILDGEIVGLRDDVAIPFTQFQARLGRKTVDEDLVKALPVALFAFDLLYQDGEVLLELPMGERRQRLEALLPGSAAVRRARSDVATDVAHLRDEFAAARARGNEGLMIKSLASTYKPGRRGKDWQKIKQPLATLDVVVTGVEWGHGKRRNVLSDYTFAVRGEDGRLMEVGKAYSGLTDAEIADLTEWFKAHTIQDYGRFRRVEPRIVLEVAFDNVQPSDRHASGFALRFPRIVRIRDDKPVAEIDTIETVRVIAQGAA